MASFSRFAFANAVGRCMLCAAETSALEVYALRRMFAWVMRPLGISLG